jgi:hypothetical protein
MELSPSRRAASFVPLQDVPSIIWWPEGSLPCLQEPSTGPSTGPEPDESVLSLQNPSSYYAYILLLHNRNKQKQQKQEG